MGHPVVLYNNASGSVVYGQPWLWILRRLKQLVPHSMVYQV